MNPNTSPGFLKRWGPWGLAALGVVALAVWALMPRPLVVEVGTVHTGRFEQAIDEDGQLRVKNRYVISAPMAAELVRPTLKVGDSVRAGDVVARLTPLAPNMIDERNRQVLQQRVGRDDAARMAAAAQLQRLQTTLTQTELEAQRAQKLASDNFIAAAALDQAVLASRAAAQALAAGQAQLRAAEFTLAESQAALAKSQPSSLTPQNTLSLTSPVEGQVVKLHLSSSAPVLAGQALLEIGDIRDMEAVVDVLSSDARQMAPGAMVRISAGVGAPPMSGHVTRIEPVAFTKVSALGIEEQRVNVIIDMDRLPDSRQRLGEGFRVDAHTTLFAHDNVLLVPSAALVREGTGWQVLVVQNGRAHAQSVTVKERNADVAWVSPDQGTGVQAGDSVLLYPGTITDGQRVKVNSNRSKR
jgi:HlyD family secretion protein